MAGDCFAASVAIFETADEAAAYYMVIGAVLRGFGGREMHERGTYDLFEAFYVSCGRIRRYQRMVFNVKSRDCAAGDGISTCLVFRSCQERDVTTDYPEMVHMLLLLMRMKLRT